MDKKDMLISIQELLKERNVEFDQADKSRIKMLRHCEKVQDDSIIGNKYTDMLVYDLYKDYYDKFLEWQCEQNHDMTNVDYIVVFIGEEECQARFIGVFQNNHDKQPEITPVGKKYDFREITGFEKLKNHVVIEWGKGTRNFIHNWTTIKEVSLMYKTVDYSGVPFFTRYEDVVFSYDQLKIVVQDRDWRKRLEACNCVYVITDKSNGKQYVGVTYKDVKSGRKNGILGRWTQYAETGHGGDVTLQQLCQEYPNYMENFQWSILELLPINVIPKMANERERKWKEKLMTVEHGYNNNY